MIKQIIKEYEKEFGVFLIPPDEETGHGLKEDGDVKTFWLNKMKEMLEELKTDEIPESEKRCCDACDAIRSGFNIRTYDQNTKIQKLLDEIESEVK